MTEDDVKRTIDAHLDEEYALADPDDLDDVKNEVGGHSCRLDNHDEQLASLNSYCNALLQALTKVAAEQGIKVRVEA